MNNYDLKRCPFCGGRAAIKLEERPDPPSRYWVFLVICADCGARTKDFPAGNFYGMEYTPDDAMEEMLIELGYGDAVEVIRSHGRWYS